MFHSWEKSQTLTFRSNWERAKSILVYVSSIYYQKAVLRNNCTLLYRLISLSFSINFYGLDIIWKDGLGMVDTHKVVFFLIKIKFIRTSRALLWILPRQQELGKLLEFPAMPKFTRLRKGSTSEAVDYIIHSLAGIIRPVIWWQPPKIQLWISISRRSRPIESNSIQKRESRGDKRQRTYRTIVGQGAKRMEDKSGAYNLEIALM